MIAIASQTKIFLHRQPTDMRKGFAGLIALTEGLLKQDPLTGHLFVFINRRRDRLKILYWGGTGFCIWYQQLEKGTYQLPEQDELAEQTKLEISSSQLSMILEGIDLSSVRQRARFRLPKQEVDSTANDPSAVN